MAMQMKLEHIAPQSTNNDPVHDIFVKREMLFNKLFGNTMFEQFAKRHVYVRGLLEQFNAYDPSKLESCTKVAADLTSPKQQVSLLAEIFNMPFSKAMFLFIVPPLSVDIGLNTEFKGICWANTGLLILDTGNVTIGSRTIFGPNVKAVLAGGHSTNAEERRSFGTDAYPITIGDDVWIGGGATIIGPCTIGNGVTIAAGSVVKGDIPDNVLIAGVPAKIKKHLDPPPKFDPPVEFLQLYNSVVAE